MTEMPVTERQVRTSRRSLFDLYHALGEGLEALQSENACLRDRLERANESMRSISERLAKAIQEQNIICVGGKWLVWHKAGNTFWTPCDTIIDALNAVESLAG